MEMQKDACKYTQNDAQMKILTGLYTVQNMIRHQPTKK
jgi:hypothetical protein